MTQIYLDTLNMDNKIEHEIYDEEIYDLFRSGVNLCPDYTLGKTTWKDFLLEN